MAYFIRRRESVLAAVRRIAVEELRGAANDVRFRQPNLHEAVHEFRKHCKKIRGLLRLLRPHLGKQFATENAFFRDHARDLSYLRDAQALLEATDRLTTRYRHEISLTDLSAIRARLLEQRESVAGGDEMLAAQLERIIDPLEQAMDRASQWKISASGFDAVEPGLIKTYGRARSAMRRAVQHPTTHHIHEWRKRIKYHWYHTRLLYRNCPRFMKPHRNVADSLGELLGQDHDCAVLRERISDDPGGSAFDQQRNLLFELIQRRQTELRTEMSNLGQILLAERPKQLASRWRVYWETARGAQQE